MSSNESTRPNEHPVALVRNVNPQRTVEGVYFAPPVPAEEGSQQFLSTLDFVLGTLRRRWKVALPLAVIFATLAVGAIYMTYVPRFRATAWLRIYRVAPYVAFPHTDDSGAYVQTQVELMRSPLVLGEVVSNPDVAKYVQKEDEAKTKDVVAWLGEKLTVHNVGRSELYTVSFDALEPDAAAVIVNTVLDSYFKFRSQQESTQALTVLELLDAEIERRQAKVKRLRDTVRELSKQVTGRDPYAVSSDPESEVRYSILTDLRNRLAAAEVEEEVLKAEIAAFEKMMAEQEIIVSESEVQQLVSQSPQVQQLRATIAGLEEKLKTYEATLRDPENSPLVAKLKADIQENQAKLAELEQQEAERIRAELKQRQLAARQDKLNQMKAELTIWQLKKEKWQQRYEEELQAAQQFAGDTFELEMQRAELQREQQVLDLIEQRALRLRTELGAPARVELLRRAEVPNKPVNTLPIKMMVFGGFAGFCLPFLIIVPWEYLVRKVGSSEELEERFHIPVLGEVARLPRRAPIGRASSRASSNGLALYQESIDSLRTCLLLSDRLSNCRTFAITSAVNNEGKTSVSVQLAASIAKATQHPTLLIDGDLRSPDVHRVLGITAQGGFADLLRGKISIDEAIVTNWSSHLHILPAGRLSASPHTLLGNGNLRKLLEKLRERYQYIVIDCPPVLSCAESMLLAKAADVALLCAMRDISRLDQVEKANERLLVTGVNLAGLVLVGVPTGTYAYRYGRYYGPAGRR